MILTYRGTSIVSGKGDRSRVSDWDAYHKGYNNIFRPKDPFYNDIKKYEGAFCGGKNSNKGVFYGGNSDSIQEDTSEDVGANPTSSTINSAAFNTPPIRHGIRKIIE